MWEKAPAVEPLTNQIPVPGPAPVPVLRRTLNLPPEDPKLDLNPLPVPPECPGLCHLQPITDIEEIHDMIPVPRLVLVPAPERAIDLPPRDPSMGHLSRSGLALLPVPMREPIHNILGSPPDSSDCSGSSPKGSASQPIPELVIVTCKPHAYHNLFLSFPVLHRQTMNKDSAILQLANEFKELRRLIFELVTNAPTLATKATRTGDTSSSPSDLVPLIPLPRRATKERSRPQIISGSPIRAVELFLH
ncbi:protein TonB-like [Macrobrachium rosenbergii]|uniref:protein TonB-like n=1 Tax=Macrobrachium rosenbergii TaxID=79674 RepID=UPI0034D3D618